MENLHGIPFVLIKTGEVYFIREVTKEPTPNGECLFFLLESEKNTLYGVKDNYRVTKEILMEVFALKEPTS